MPTRLNGEQLKPSQYPPLFKILVKAALMILQGEQQRLNTGGKEEALQLTEELIRYAYNQGPFNSQYWDNSTKPLKFWRRLSNDSNAKQIGRITVKLFSILTSEICDERTASHLGWFNAARRSSILPENLIGCARLYDFYTNGISEGTYSHEAHVLLDEVLAPSGTTLNKSVPSLMDLLHEENISPSEFNRDALEDLLFNHPDPYDLAEADRYDFPKVTRSGSVFAIAEYIKLDSEILAELLRPSERDADVSMEPATGPQAGRPDDWVLEEFLN
ncbi:hypothetical protein B0H10DRAFT_1962959 [Mycena sp. CBHHK59/15]|nr:hypothetical protein B0H10DRAFT_1962959 [Mycena sp. CBHHK59/15]